MYDKIEYDNTKYCGKYMDTLPLELTSMIYEYLTLPKDKLKFALSGKYARRCMDDESKRVLRILQLMYPSVHKIDNFMHHFISKNGLTAILLGDKMVKYRVCNRRVCGNDHIYIYAGAMRTNCLDGDIQQRLLHNPLRTKICNCIVEDFTRHKLIQEIMSQRGLQYICIYCE